MPNRLADAVSPYLRSHAENPVDWYQWGIEPFAEAERRQVPVLISIGYSTCHWCHVMARESFSDPVLAEYLNANFVSVKVDREEHPDVDSSYLAAAGAFTGQLGWPLTVFATPRGRAFFAGTYFPPVTIPGHPSFLQMLDAVLEAWRDHRDEVESTASRLAAALTGAANLRGAAALTGAADFSGVADPRTAARSGLPGENDLDGVVAELSEYEDAEFGGFGGAPKFPVAPVLNFLLERESAGNGRAGSLARRALDAMAASSLRDPIEGGFFRYAVRRDWTEPHYERMLYDNAQLLLLYARAGNVEIAEGIAGFLLSVLRLPSGGFASAQDSESVVDGQRVEGGYYALDSAGRSAQPAPALDDKVLTGWNGFAIEALAYAGRRMRHPEWVEAARSAAAVVSPGEIVRARIGEVISRARPALEDYGTLANGLLELALATGEPDYAVRARQLITAATGASATGSFAVPGGADPVLLGHGLALEADPSEGAYPSGLSACAGAAYRLYLLTADTRMLEAAATTMVRIAPLATTRAISFGSALAVMSLLRAGVRQLVIVTDDEDAPLATAAREWQRAGAISAVVTEDQAKAWAAAGFELFEQRGLRGGEAAAYLCEDFVCRLPVTDPGELMRMLA